MSLLPKIPTANELGDAAKDVTDHLDTMLDTQRVDLMAAIEHLLRTKKITILIEDREG